MDNVNNTTDTLSNDTVDLLMALNRWLRANQDIAIDIPKDQFKKQLSRLHLLELQPPIQSQTTVQSNANEHWIAVRLLSALAWQRRRLNNTAIELCRILRICALHAHTNRAVYHYQRMSEICNELCILAAKTSLLETTVATQLYDLGVEDAVPYLSTFHHNYH